MLHCIWVDWPAGGDSAGCQTGLCGWWWDQTWRSSYTFAVNMFPSARSRYVDRWLVGHRRSAVSPPPPISSPMTMRWDWTGKGRNVVHSYIHIPFVICWPLWGLMPDWLRSCAKLVMCGKFHFILHVLQLKYYLNWCHIIMSELMF